MSQETEKKKKKELKTTPKHQPADQVHSQVHATDTRDETGSKENLWQISLAM